MPKHTKIAQEIASCKHPLSRKTIAIQKQIKKDSNRKKQKFAGNLKLNLIGEKIAWFKENISEESKVYNANQTQDIITKYLSRFDEELDQIKLKHSIGQRKNRQHASREDIINLTIKREKEEYTGCGLEIPDLLNQTQFELLKNWNGELRFIQNFKLKRYSETNLEKLKNKLSKGDKKEGKAEDPSMEVGN